MEQSKLFCIYSTGAYPKPEDLVLMVMKKKDIIELGYARIKNSDTRFEEMAGIPFSVDEDGDFLEYEREISKEEEFKCSVEVLGRDYHVFETFETNTEGALYFLDRVKRLYANHDKAMSLILDEIPDFTV